MIRKAEIISERMPSKVAVQFDLSPTGALICLYSLGIFTQGNLAAASQRNVP